MVNANFKNSPLPPMIFRLTLTKILLLASPNIIYGEDLPSGYVITSESAVISKNLETITYLGKVKLKHERFLITGEKLTISYNERKGRNISIAGNPSCFKGTSKRNKSDISAAAKEIIYEELAQLLVFKGNTLIHRNGDTLEATSVNYNLATQKISARSKEGESPVRLTIKSLQ